MCIQHTVSSFNDYDFFESQEYKVCNDLVKDLSEIATLSVDHEFYISLTDYQQTLIESIGMSLLDRVFAVELIAFNIETHIKPFTERHFINLDTFLFEYCIDTLDSCANGLLGPSGNWEPRILSLLECINDLNVKAELILECMKRVAIPWSEEIDCAIKGISVNLPAQLQQDVTEQLRLIELKRMILRYGITTFK